MLAGGPGPARRRLGQIQTASNDHRGPRAQAGQGPSEGSEGPGPTG